MFDYEKRSFRDMINHYETSGEWAHRTTFLYFPLQREKYTIVLNNDKLICQFAPKLHIFQGRRPVPTVKTG